MKWQNLTDSLEQEQCLSLFKVLRKTENSVFGVTSKLTKSFRENHFYQRTNNHFIHILTPKVENRLRSYTPRLTAGDLM